eukprot:m.287203 g.287203  ORF g.287203 m.287203 type:complete len:643 (-) comp11729_c0_seq1:200-2128(-)
MLFSSSVLHFTALLSLLAAVLGHVPHDEVSAAAVSADCARFLTVTRAGLYRSTDGGNTWLPSSSGILTNSVVTGSKIVFGSKGRVSMTIGGALFFSRDDGASWSPASPAPNNVKALVGNPGADDSTTVLALQENGNLWRSTDAGDTFSSVNGNFVAVDWTSHLLVAATPTALFKSTNDGATWQQILKFPKAYSLVGISVIDAARVLLATSDQGTLLGKIKRGKVINRSGGLTEKTITSVSRSANFLFVTTWNDGIFRSSTKGAPSWVLVSQGFPTDGQADSMNVPHFSVVHSTQASKCVAAGTFDGLHVSTNQGNSWTRRRVLHGAIVGLDVAGNQPRALIMTYATGARYTDGANALTQTNGIDLKWMEAIAASPDFDNDRVAFAAGFKNIYRSTNGGQSWGPVGYPNVGGWRAAVSLAVSPTFSKDGLVLIGNTPKSVFRSTNGGKTFQEVWNSLNDVAVLLFSPEYAQDGMIFAALKAKGIHRSTDEGKSWTKVANHNDATIAAARVAKGKIALFAGTSNGLHVSYNGGTTWKKLTANAVARGGLGVSPNFAVDGRLIYQIHGGNLMACTVLIDRLVCQTTNRPHDVGFSQLYGFNRSRSSLIVFSPNFAKDDTIYAAAGLNLYRSTNGGFKWTHVDATE